LMFSIAQRLFGDALVVPIRLLSGGSLAKLFRRLARIRNVAGSMAHGGLRPPMPVRLQVETTDVCNLKCRMCTREMLTGMNSRDMEPEQFEKFVEEVNPFYVTLNGLGEPLIDNTIFQKLGFLHGRGIMTSMPTNGTYIRRNKLAGLAQNAPDILQLSIDGATKESFEYIRVDGDFETIIGNYRQIVDYQRRGMVRPGTKIRILCALQKRNLFDFKEMFRLVQSMPGIDGFNLVPVFNYDADGSTFAHLIPSAGEVLDAHDQLDRAIAATDDEAERAFYRNWKSTSANWLNGRRWNGRCGEQPPRLPNSMVQRLRRCQRACFSMLLSQ
jgi:sulfatase maturation enzyme AslB (radical SAM superfamily)